MHRNRNALRITFCYWPLLWVARNRKAGRPDESQKFAYTAAFRLQANADNVAPVLQKHLGESRLYLPRFRFTLAFRHPSKSKQQGNLDR